MLHTLCTHCGQDLLPVKALGCGRDGRSVVIELPGMCTDQKCSAERDAAAIAKAAASGLIDP